MNFLAVYIIAVAKLRLVFMSQRFVRISFGSSVLKTLDFGSEGVGCRFWYGRAVIVKLNMR